MTETTNKLNVLMVGTGEYTTGFVNGAQSTSDKKVGVIGLSMFDLRRRGKVDKISIVGTNGKKFPAIREHLKKNIGEVYNMDTTLDHSCPADDQVDPDACKFVYFSVSPSLYLQFLLTFSTFFFLKKKKKL